MHGQKQGAGATERAGRGARHGQPAAAVAATKHAVGLSYSCIKHSATSLQRQQQEHGPGSAHAKQSAVAAAGGGSGAAGPTRAPRAATRTS